MINNNTSICIVNQSNNIDIDEFHSGVGAIRHQLNTDFNSVWGGTYDVIPTNEPLTNYIPVYIRDSISGNVAGYHWSDLGAMAYAIVEWGPEWTLTASHECIEMIFDPFGHATARCYLPASITDNSNATFQVIQELCDPCQNINCAYKVNYNGHDFLVSDFVTDNYYSYNSSDVDMLTFNNKKHKNIKSPCDIAPGGTLGWIGDDNNLYQAVSDLNGAITVNELGPFDVTLGPLREFLNLFDRSFTKLSQNVDGHGINGHLHHHEKWHHFSKNTKRINSIVQDDLLYKESRIGQRLSRLSSIYDRGGEDE